MPNVWFLGRGINLVGDAVAVGLVVDTLLSEDVSWLLSPLIAAVVFAVPAAIVAHAS
jgi:hypothetical protein